MKKYGLFSVWILATAYAFASLYFTEIYLASCCSLVWIERICLFPLVIIAGMAAWYGFLGIAAYLLPQTLIGLGFSCYHLLLLRGVSWVPPQLGCAAQITNQPILIPLVSLGCFLLINALLILIYRISKKGPQLV